MSAARHKSDRRRSSGATRLRQRGFTLLEVAVALAVIAIAFTALLSLHARNLRLAAREEAYTQALFLAETMTGRIEAQLDGFPEVGMSEGDFESLYPGQYPGLRWQQIVGETPFPEVRSVTVRVVPIADPQGAADLTLFVKAAT